MAGAFSGHLMQSYNDAKQAGPGSPGIITSGAVSFNSHMHGTAAYHAQSPFAPGNFALPFSPSSAYPPFAPPPFTTPPSSSSPSPDTALHLAALQAKLNKKLGPEFLSQRPGPGGGPKLTYAEGWKIINLANEVFGFNGWSSGVVSLGTDYCECAEGRWSVGVSAIVRVTLRDGAFHEDTGYGTVENLRNRGAALDKCKKEAVTDALKRTLRNFGNLLGNCLYDKAYASEVVKIKVPPAKFDRSELYRRPEFEDAKPPAPNTVPTPAIAHPPNNHRNAQSTSRAGPVVPKQEHPVAVPKQEPPVAVPKQQPPVTKQEPPVTKRDPHVPPPAIKREPPPARPELRPPNADAGPEKEKPIAYIPRHLRPSTPQVGPNPPQVRPNPPQARSNPPQAAAHPNPPQAPAPAPRPQAQAASTPNRPSGMPPPAHRTPLVRQSKPGPNPNPTGLNTPVQTPAGQPQRRVSFVEPAASSSNAPSASGSNATSGSGSGSNATSASDSNTGNTGDAQDAADIPDDDSICFNSDDDAFLAVVDLGEGDLGRPVDVSGEFDASGDLGRPIDASEDLGRPIEGELGRPIDASEDLGRPIDFEEGLSGVSMDATELDMAELLGEGSGQVQARVASGGVGVSHASGSSRAGGDGSGPGSSRAGGDASGPGSSRAGGDGSVSGASRTGGDKPRPSIPAMGGFHYPPGMNPPTVVHPSHANANQNTHQRLIPNTHANPISHPHPNPNPNPNPNAHAHQRPNATHGVKRSADVMQMQSGSRRPMQGMGLQHQHQHQHQPAHQNHNQHQHQQQQPAHQHQHQQHQHQQTAPRRQPLANLEVREGGDVKRVKR